MNDDLVYRLRKRSDIRRSAISRKSVQDNEPDRISDLLEEAAAALEVQPLNTTISFRNHFDAWSAIITALYEVDPSWCDDKKKSPADNAVDWIKARNEV